MSPPDIPENVRQFIFGYIDSAEQLEVLLLLGAKPTQEFTPDGLAQEMRSSPESVRLRLEALVRIGIVSRLEDNRYIFAPKNDDDKRLVADLADAYRIYRHKILALIFSPLKKARQFADAFVVGKIPNRSEDDNG